MRGMCRMWSACLVATLLMRLVDPAFGHPRGVMGRLGGALMARGNAEQERWAIEHAALRSSERVLVIGHGPGIGLGLAATAVGPTGHVVGVDPAEAMREMAARRCADEIAKGLVELHARGAESTGCADASIDVALSVNNIMLWDREAGFTALARVLRPGGRLVVTVHRHVLDVSPEQLRTHAEQSGFEVVTLTTRARRGNSPAVELLAKVATPARSP